MFIRHLKLISMQYAFEFLNISIFIKINKNTTAISLLFYNKNKVYNIYNII